MRLRLYGTDNALVLSNATLTAFKHNAAEVCYLPYVDGDRCSLSLSGTNAQFRILSTLAQVRAGSSIHFDLPKDGYVQPAIYMPSGSLTLSDGVLFSFDLTERPNKTVWCPLFSAPTYHISDATLEAITAALPPRCRLVLRDGVYYARIGGDGGFSLIVR